MKTIRRPILAILLGAFLLTSGCAIVGPIPILATIIVGATVEPEEENEYEVANTFPMVSGVLPDRGPQAGGTSVQVFGLRFLSGATVTMGGTPAANVVRSAGVPIETALFWLGRVIRFWKSPMRSHRAKSSH